MKYDTTIMECRSKCPISCTLELVGDKWSLLIIRDMLVFNKSTYNEFLNSPEKIATNILNLRLVKLEKMGLITHSGTDKRKKYKLTKVGQDLMPVLEAIVLFGLKHFKGTKAYMKKQVGQRKGIVSQSLLQ